MSLIRCPACRAHISTGTSFCPKCGKPKPKGGWQRPGQFLWSILAGTGMLFIMANIYISVTAP